MPALLYTPPDVDEAHEAWGANCGPVALAAAFERPVMSVFEAVAQLPKNRASKQLGLGIGRQAYRGYMGVGHLREAVKRLGGCIGKVWRPFEPTHVGPDHPVACCPEGVLLVMVEWLGPWSGTRGQAVHRLAFRVGMFNPTRALRLVEGDRSHLEDRSDRVGPLWVFDANYGWAPMGLWNERLAPRLMPERATSWRMSWAGEVQLRCPGVRPRSPGAVPQSSGSPTRPPQRCT